ncbi:MAG: PspC domain-containing protein [Lachnospiraceae bacterium]|nr:PspC domain-containing protein [Lachnospiraceae bacterium]MCI5588194.1 PspC domain-containing protein [Lachnospiraceae bacterium]
MNNRKLRRSTGNKILFGVCSGIADFFGIDPTIVRLIWAILVCCMGTGILLYIVCALIIPPDIY